MYIYGDAVATDMPEAHREIVQLARDRELLRSSSPAPGHGGRGGVE